ncbi:class II aldolase/adducin family protein [Propionicimonas sp.]|uniref:class II aldolase/adducin family protein n=1 Tax=Propionicimonas sp. TaxID=1955623 RepID=UPI0039E21DC1
MHERQKEEVISTGRMLDRYGLVALSGGNVSLRVGEHILVTPSGLMYEQLTPDDVPVLTPAGDVVEGDLRPSVDTGALLHIYNAMPEVQAVIHTHQPYATALGLSMDELPCCVTTMANAVKGPVRVASFTSAATEEMGVQAVANLDGRLAVVLRKHGVIAIGATLKQALYACVYLEEAAKTYAVAKSLGEPVDVLTDEQVREAVGVFDNYGQSGAGADFRSVGSTR